MILPGERVARCGHHLVGPQATICLGENGAYVAGVETCGSVWVCPVCAAKIAEGRRREVAQCLDAHVRVGGDVYMGLFTIPHHALESCKELKQFVAKAWQKLLAGAPWKRAKERFGIIGFIRALEVTHGSNGWHPHIHTLFLTEALTPERHQELKIWLGDRWAAIVNRLTGKAVNLGVGYNLQKACSISAAGDYVAKWGVDSEISKAHLKVSKKGGSSPWQLLGEAHAGDRRAQALFREYAKAMKSARHLTWSRGLRHQYAQTLSLSDHDLASSSMPFGGDRVIGVISRADWQHVYSANMVVALLTAAEMRGWRGVACILSKAKSKRSGRRALHSCGTLSG